METILWEDDFKIPKSSLNVQFSDFHSNSERCENSNKTSLLKDSSKVPGRLPGISRVLVKV